MNETIKENSALIGRGPAVSQKPPRWKQRLLIDTRGQLIFLSHVVFTSVVISAGNSIMSNRAVLATFVGPRLAESALVPMLVFAIYFTMITIGMIYSNRVFGPVYRLKKHLQSLANGENIPNLQFRKGDHFQDLADDLNRVMERRRDATEPR